MVKSMKVARQEGTSQAERETKTKKKNGSKSSEVKISDTSVKQNSEGTRETTQERWPKWETSGKETGRGEE